MARLEIKQITVLRDNYVYMVNHRGSGTAAVIDPGIAGPVVAELDNLGWRVRKIFCTHQHADQIGGNLDMKNSYNCEIFGPEAEANKIPGITKGVKDGDNISIGDAQGVVLSLPGHTIGHVGYHFPTAKALFCGDVLSPLGCGKVLGGTVDLMWESLKKIKALPGDTQVYCAHEHSERNYKFARKIDRENQAIRQRGQTIRENITAGTNISVPFLLSEEIAMNPFLRADTPEMAEMVGMPEGTDPEDVFDEIRRRRDDVG
ncbi:MAG: hydroxyacylglutathione hydrolase [Alphaproteobacteria bacterium]|jgi:hydroxyacylglutathione hydrolase|nr:hydroxyacylglutathione hydrolase [Alphaproteobacteria bacterium]MBT4710945.1 hydroxyacylglutathione hydrolase [Alphaproteobacteria bacterium]MBT5859845.1 hydroxyacylglutathione hydrolase [Alphaproteobacteria bacterium]